MDVPHITDEMAHTLGEWFRALSDETRIKLLVILKEEGEQSVGALAEALRLTQTSASKHLAVLRAARIVKTRREGTTIHYSLRDESIPQICSIVCQNVLDHHERLRSGIMTSKLVPAKRPRRASQ